MINTADITLVGNIVREPEYKKAGDTDMVDMLFAVAVNWGSGDRKNAAFYDVRWRMNQESYKRNYFTFQGAKGKPVFIQGALRPRKQTDGRGYSFLNVEFARVIPLWNDQGARAGVPQPEPTPEPETHLAPPPEPEPPKPSRNSGPLPPPVG